MATAVRTEACIRKNWSVAPNTFGARHCGWLGQGWVFILGVSNSTACIWTGPKVKPEFSMQEGMKLLWASPVSRANIVSSVGDCVAKEGILVYITAL